MAYWTAPLRLESFQRDLRGRDRRFWFSELPSRISSGVDLMEFSYGWVNALSTPQPDWTKGKAGLKLPVWEISSRLRLFYDLVRLE